MPTKTSYFVATIIVLIMGIIFWKSTGINPLQSKDYSYAKYFVVAAENCEKGECKRIKTIINGDCELIHRFPNSYEHCRKNTW